MLERVNLSHLKWFRHMRKMADRIFTKEYRELGGGGG